MKSRAAGWSLAAGLLGVAIFSVGVEGGFLRAGGGSTGSGKAGGVTTGGIPANWPFTKSSKGCTDDCRTEYGGKEKPSFEAFAPSGTGSTCKCTASHEEDCTCGSDCTDEEVLSMCQTIHGACACQRADSAVCECSGYCHSNDDRIRACEGEAGCAWTGSWCEAEIGLLWS